MPRKDQKEETFDFLNEGVLQVEKDMQRMYFSEASNQKGFGVGILLVSPKWGQTPISVKLDFDVTNNVAE